MSFEEKIRTWVSIDNEIKSKNDSIKQLREKKNNLNQEINSYIESNNLNNSIIQITDGTLKYNSIKTSQPLTFRFIRECLTNCIEDEETIEHLMNYIKEHREIKEHNELKRYYNK